jgi:hypothetical protein
MTRTRLAYSSLALLLVHAAGCSGAPASPAASPAGGPGYAAPAQEAEPARGMAMADAPADAAKASEAPAAMAAPEPMAEPMPATPAASPPSGGMARPSPPPPPRPTSVATAEASAARGAPVAKPSRPAKIAADEGGRTPLPVAVMQQPEAAVKAGEWDDNANYREFQKWILSEQAQRFHRADITDRQFIVVRDVDGKAMPRCPVVITDGQGRKVTLTTTASGRSILFPHAEGLSGKDFTATTSCQNSSGSTRFSLSQSDGVVDLKLAAKRVLPATRDVDIAFILDTTGSMSEEIAAVKATIQKVAAAFNTSSLRVRVGLVEYKDRTDSWVTKVYPMTSDVARFSGQVAAIQASGGGDTPESMNEGLHVGLNNLAWSSGAIAKLAFLIADAPPHLDYANDADYAADMRDAAHRGIQVFTVAASGMDDLGQVVFRQIAQYTGATNLFVMRGGAGAQSVGGGDPKSSCGGTQTAFRSGNLDALILQKVTRELKGLDRDPLKIAGLRVDENAKPCSERLMVAE